MTRLVFLVQVTCESKTGEKKKYDGDLFGCKRYIGCKGDRMENLWFSHTLNL